MPAMILPDGFTLTDTVYPPAVGEGGRPKLGEDGRPVPDTTKPGLTITYRPATPGQVLQFESDCLSRPFKDVYPAHLAAHLCGWDATEFGTDRPVPVTEAAIRNGLPLPYLYAAVGRVNAHMADGVPLGKGSPG